VYAKAVPYMAGTTRSSRIEVRTTPDTRALTDRAVVATGTDLTTFVGTNLTDAAARVLADRTEFALDPEVDSLVVSPISPGACRLCHLRIYLPGTAEARALTRSLLPCSSTAGPSRSATSTCTTRPSSRHHQPMSCT